MFSPPSILPDHPHFPTHPTLGSFSLKKKKIKQQQQNIPTKTGTQNKWKTNKAKKKKNAQTK